MKAAVTKSFGGRSWGNRSSDSLTIARDASEAPSQGDQLESQRFRQYPLQRRLGNSGAWTSWNPSTTKNFGRLHRLPFPLPRSSGYEGHYLRRHHQVVGYCLGKERKPYGIGHRQWPSIRLTGIPKLPQSQGHPPLHNSGVPSSGERPD